MAERAIEAGCTVFGTCEIRVALLPVGDVPKDVWEEYTSLITQHAQMDLAVMRSFYHEKQKSPFTQLPWSTGALHFKFLRGADADPQAAVTKRTVLSASHKVHGVIGICHSPTYSQINALYSGFEQRCRLYPDAFTLRCFAFEPSDNQVEEDSKSAAYLIMFPPDDKAKLQYHMGVMMNDFAACVLMELEKWMLNASPAMINMSTWLDSAEFAVPVSTLEEVQKRLTSDEEVARKRRHGRLRKAMGDHCMLAGSPKNAAEHYSTAIDLSRAVNDFIWLGAAIEGQISCKVMSTLLENMPATPSTTIASTSTESLPGPDPADVPEGEDGGLWGSQISLLSSSLSCDFGRDQVMDALRMSNLDVEALELFSEAGTSYQKPKAVFLKLELDLKQARLLAGLHGQSKRKRVLDLVTGIVESAKKLQRPEDRLVATMEAAEICGIVRAVRKRALLLWRATELCRAWEDPRPARASRALTLIRQALLPNLTTPGVWRAHLPNKGDHEIIATATETAGSEQGDSGRYLTVGGTTEMGTVRVSPSWPSVHCAVLEALLGASTRTRSHQQAWRAAAAILCYYATRLEEKRQEWLLETLQVASKFTDQNVLRGPGPPPLIDLVAIHPPAEWLAPIDVVPNKDGKKEKGLFIFNPFESVKAAERGIRWVTGEEVRVDVQVSNPCATLMQVERMSLAGFYEHEIQEAGDAVPYPKPKNYTHWRGVAKKVSLPPRTPPSLLDLTGIAKTPGRIFITGCYVQMFGVTWHQPWRDTPSTGEMLCEELISTPSGKSRHRDPFRGLVVDVVPPMQLAKGFIEGDRLVWVRGSGVREPVYTHPGASDTPLPPADVATAHKREDDAVSNGQPIALETVAYEGEVLSWNLKFKNIGRQPITAAVISTQVLFLNDAAEQAHSMQKRAAPTSKLGMSKPYLHLDIKREVLQQQLPLERDELVTVPISVRIGESPMDGEAHCKITVNLEYLGDGGAQAPLATDGTLPPLAAGMGEQTDAEGSTSVTSQLGRKLELPISVTIRRMLKICGCDIYARDDLTDSMSQQQTVSRCCMEVSVENSGDHAYQAWLSQADGQIHGESQDVSIIQSGESATIIGLLPQMINGLPPTEHGVTLQQTAQLLSGAWGIHWQQLPKPPGAAGSEAPGGNDGRPAAGDTTLLPRGFVPFEESIVSAAMSREVLHTLAPPSISVEYIPALPMDAGRTAIQLRHVSELLEVKSALSLRVNLPIEKVCYLPCQAPWCPISSILHHNLRLGMLHSFCALVK